MRTHTRRSADQWQAIIAEQRAGTLSAPKFCEQHDIGYASFCQWRKRLSNTATGQSSELQPAFVAVDSSPHHSANPNWVVELQLSADMVLRIGKL